MMPRAGIVHDIFQLCCHGIIDPVRTAQRAHCRGYLPDHDNAKTEVNGKRGFSRLFSSAAKRATAGRPLNSHFFSPALFSWSLFMKSIGCSCKEKILQMLIKCKVNSGLFGPDRQNKTDINRLSKAVFVGGSPAFLFSHSFQIVAFFVGRQNSPGPRQPCSRTFL